MLVVGESVNNAGTLHSNIMNNTKLRSPPAGLYGSTTVKDTAKEPPIIVLCTTYLGPAAIDSCNAGEVRFPIVEACPGTGAVHHVLNMSAEV